MNNAKTQWRERGKNTNKEKKQQTYEQLWRFTWVKTHVQRCEGQRAHRFAKRCGRYVEKTGADGVGWFLWFPFFWIFNRIPM